MKIKDASKDELSLLPAFTSNMVLQRETNVNFQGNGRPGRKVVAIMDGKTVSETTIGKNGSWKINIPPQNPGGPHCIEFQSEGDVLRLENVLFGDIWVCSGQSNMEWAMANIKDARSDIADCENRSIRLFTVSKNATTRKTFQCTGEWLECNPENLPSFSAVGYYFGREIEKYIDVPIALINTSWGGTTAEAWTSKDALYSVENLKYLVSEQKRIKNKNELKKYLKISGQKRDIERNSDGTLPDPGRAAFTQGWEQNDYDDSKWIPVELPSDIERFGLEIDGAIWFRKKISLPESFKGRNLVLSLGIIDDFDISYFNGEEIGSTGKETPNWWAVPRFYKIPARLTSVSDTVIAVRVFDHFMNGGMLGPSESMRIYPENEPEKVISLKGEWLSAIELAVEQPAKSRPSSSELFNAMINPLLPLKIKGAIWYQGESNADRPFEYITLLKTMITDWRKRWNSGDFPFFIVQLANFMQIQNEATESLWAQLRNSQNIVAQELTNCGLATAIDIGEADNIHPQNKKDVGIRLALQALRKTYRLKSVHCDCPRAISAKQDGETIVVNFETEGFALMTKDGAEPREFAIGDMSGKYYWAASAEIAGTKVILKIPCKISKPQKIRYAWADNPQVNLYDESGLPALPFELQVK